MSIQGLSSAISFKSEAKTPSFPKRVVNELNRQLQAQEVNPKRRKIGIIGLFTFAAVFADMFANNKIADYVIKKTKTQMRFSALKLLVTAGAVAAGALAGYGFYEYDKNHRTKLGDYCQWSEGYSRVVHDIIKTEQNQEDE